MPDAGLSATGIGLPSSTGSRRIGWSALPDEVTAGVQTLLGAEVVAAASQPGGFSEGLASLLTLADGRRVFVKAANSLTAPDVVRYHRREAAITPQLPATLAPRLLDVYDDGTWVALILEQIVGQLPAQPWRPDELDRVLAALTDLARVLTPATVAAQLLAAPRLGGWSALAANDTARARLPALSRWAADHLTDLIALEALAPQALDGQTLLHGDLYPFNIMLTADRVTVIDWPHAWIGASHCDAVTLMSSASLSGVDPQQLAEHHPLTAAAQPQQINVMLAMHAGFLLHNATTAEPDTDPNLLAMAVALGTASLRWLRQRL